MFRFILCLFCLMLPLTASGELYKVVKHGRIAFTDKAPEIGATEHTLVDINTIGSNGLKKGSYILPFTTENGTMMVNGSINGVAMRFIVDTGATLVTIPPKMADSANLPLKNSKQLQAMTANGTVTVFETQIAELIIEKIRRHHVVAAIHDMKNNDARLGLLGMSFFEAYKMTINQHTSEILLEEK